MSGTAKTPRDGLVVRPHPAFVLFYPIRQYAGIIVLTACAWLGLIVLEMVEFESPFSAGWALAVGGVLAGVRFVWAILQWATRGYGVTETGRLWSAFGVLNRRKNEIDLAGLRLVSVDRPFFQRLFGVGSIGFATAGTSGFEVTWVIVRDPDGLAKRVQTPSKESPHD